MISDRFDLIARKYNHHMRRTNYMTPQLLLAAMHEYMTDTFPKIAVLDLGCGTGLCGALFRKYARQLDGVDVSREMINEACKKIIYDNLEVSDLTVHLKHSARVYDVVISGGVLQYFSGISDHFALVSLVLGDHGYYAFTADKLEDGASKWITSPYDKMMFAHDPRYIKKAAAAAHFELIKSAEFTDRNDWNDPNKLIPGMLYVLKKG